MIVEVKLVLVLFFVAILGYLSGSWGRRVIPGELSSSSGSSAPSLSQPGKRPPVMIPSTLTSPDSIETLAAVPASELFDRLALWLLDASPGEMQEFWADYSQRSDRNNDLTELVFLGWTRVDPEAAFAAAEGTGFANYPWWAWACHEPEKALAEVLARFQGTENQEPIGNVMSGIGEFHPAWLRAHLDEFPEEWMRDHALSGYLKRADTENPRESIEFLKEQGRQIDPRAIIALGLENPLEAHALTGELSKGEDRYQYRNLSEQLFDSLATENPELIDQLLANTGSPKERMKLKSKQFEARLAEDPITAEEEIKKMPGSWLKEDFITALARHYLETDPAKALELTSAIFLEPGYEGMRQTRTYSAGERLQTYPAGPSPAEGLLNHFIKDSPAELMAAITPEDGYPSGVYRNAATKWADHDLVGFADWARDVEAPFTYVVSAGEVTKRLLEQDQYREAMEWAESISAATGTPSYHLPEVYRDWVANDPEGAGRWRQSAQLTDPQKKSIDEPLR